MVNRNARFKDWFKQQGMGLHPKVGAARQDVSLFLVMAGCVAATAVPALAVPAPTLLPLYEQAALIGGGSSSGGRQGNSVAISGDTAVVGAPGYNNGRGAVYVFVRSGPYWVEQARLTASDAAAGDNFGDAVVIEGDTVVVGAPLEERNVLGTDAGAAYVFTRSGSVWSQRAKLTASDAFALDHFGQTVALDGGTIAVGAPLDDHSSRLDAGRVYVFVGGGASWSQQAQLSASDRESFDFLGSSLALEGDTVVAGAPGDDHSGRIDAGSAYVFTRSGGSWSQQAKLIGDSPAALDYFGSSVSISGERVAVGAPFDGPISGAVHVFQRDSGTWGQQAKLSTFELIDGFGRSVALEGNHLVVGAPAASGFNGAVFAYGYDGANWTLLTQAGSEQGVLGDAFGTSVALSNGRIVVGAPLKSSGAGYASVFSTGPTAVNDYAATAENTSVTVGVVLNDEDAEGDPLTPLPIKNPDHGTLAVNPDGSLTYTPNVAFRGDDTFTYKATDGNSISNLATVKVTVGVQDVTGQVNLSLVRVVPNVALGTYVHYVQVTNTGADVLPNTFSLVFSDLPALTTVTNRTGLTTGAAYTAFGLPYVSFSQLGGLAPGQSVTVLVRFQSRYNLTSLPGTPRLLAGIGNR